MSNKQRSHWTYKRTDNTQTDRQTDGQIHVVIRTNSVGPNTYLQKTVHIINCTHKQAERQIDTRIQIQRHRVEMRSPCIGLRCLGSGQWLKPIPMIGLPTIYMSITEPCIHYTYMYTRSYTGVLVHLHVGCYACKR